MRLTYFVNNNGTMELTQEYPDEDVRVHTYHGAADYSDTSNDLIIPPGDMVMLVNLYRHVKENDIYNGFINPHGKKGAEQW